MGDCGRRCAASAPFPLCARIRFPRTGRHAPSTGDPLLRVDRWPGRRAGSRESLPTVRTLDFLRFWPGRQGRQGRQALFQIRVRIAILLRMWKSPFRRHCTEYSDKAGVYLSTLAEACPAGRERSEEHTSELQSLMRISYAVFCLKKKT